MPFTIDEERFKKQASFDVSAADNSKSGIPVKPIPILEYPMAVYKHPSEPFLKVEHRNAMHEIVDVEMVPAEHLVLIVNDKKELEKALKDGWRRDAYIPQAPPNPNANVYASK